MMNIEGPGMVGNRPLQRLAIILLMVQMVLSVFIVPIDGAGATADGSIGSRQGSGPPPADSNGESWGDWIVETGSSEWVNLTFHTLKLHGNITLKSGSNMRLNASSKIIQTWPDGETYSFWVQDGSHLVVEKGSTITTGSFIAAPDSTVTFSRAELHANGVVEIKGRTFSLEGSLLENVGSSGEAAMPGADAVMTFDVSTLILRDSVIRNIGGQGGTGTTSSPGGDAGGSYIKLLFDQSTITNLSIEVLGGTGGAGKDAMNANGYAGGDGGDAELHVSTPTDKDLVIDGLTLNVRGGNGQKAGNGAEAQTSNGGNGGYGGTGGYAKFYLATGVLKVKDSLITLNGGDGGKGGTGGASTDGAGGNGGVGGHGEMAHMTISAVESLQMNRTTVSVNGGIGGDGGFFGLGTTVHGNAGNGGVGGQAVAEMSTGQALLLGSSALSNGGTGGRGGLGAVVGGNGGIGGDALFHLTAVTLDCLGSGAGLLDLGASGGDGGSRGEEDGRGGDGGASTVILDVSSQMVLERTHVIVHDSQPGIGGYGKGGTRALDIRTDDLQAKDGAIDFTIMDLNRTSMAILENVSFGRYPLAVLGSTECGGIVKAWYYLTVHIKDATPDQHWEVSVYSGELSDGNLVAASTISGENRTARFMLLGSTVDCRGQVDQNYSVIARWVGTNVVTTHKNIVLAANTEVGLEIGCLLCLPPQVRFTNPGVNEVIVKSKNLAPCRPPTPGEIANGYGAPGCLRVSGESWVDGTEDGVIDDIRLWLVHGTQGTYLYRPNSDPQVVMVTPGTRRTNWYFEWDIGQIDMTTGDFLWSEGRWTVMVSVHQRNPDVPLEYFGGYWSETKAVNITLVHPTGLEPSNWLSSAGVPKEYEIKVGRSGVKAEFSDASVLIRSGTVKIIRMEWDYDEDGVIDWSYTDLSCEGNITECPAPVTHHVYTTAGSYNATFCAIDSKGRTSCDSVKVHISKENEPVVLGVPRTVLILLTGTIVGICAVIITALLVTSMSEATRYAVMAFILVPLYTRLKKEEMLDNYTRGEIRGYIVANPGAHYSRIKRDLNLNNGTLIYHLMALEREGFIYSHRDDYYRRFYPRGRKPRPGPNLTTIQETIIEMLLENPGLSADEIADRLGKSRKVVNYHLVWLRRWGQVEAKDDGRRKVYKVLYEDETELREDGVKTDGVGLKDGEGGAGRPSGPANEEGDGPSVP